jgi:CubicO group peptidase (beta-lactamase class C family)
MNEGRADEQTVLSQEWVRTMLQPHIPTTVSGVSQGLGWFICVEPKEQPVLHISKTSFGAKGASGTFGWVDPDRS